MTPHSVCGMSHFDFHIISALPALVLVQQPNFFITVLEQTWKPSTRRKLTSWIIFHVKSGAGCCHCVAEERRETRCPFNIHFDNLWRFILHSTTQREAQERFDWRHIISDTSHSFFLHISAEFRNSCSHCSTQILILCPNPAIWRYVASWLLSITDKSERMFSLSESNLTGWEEWGGEEEQAIFVVRAMKIETAGSCQWPYAHLYTVYASWSLLWKHIKLLLNISFIPSLVRCVYVCFFEVVEGFCRILFSDHSLYLVVRSTVKANKKQATIIISCICVQIRSCSFFFFLMLCKSARCPSTNLTLPSLLGRV